MSVCVCVDIYSYISKYDYFIIIIIIVINCWTILFYSVINFLTFLLLAFVYVLVSFFCFLFWFKIGFRSKNLNGICIYLWSKQKYIFQFYYYLFEVLIYGMQKKREKKIPTEPERNQPWVVLTGSLMTFEKGSFGSIMVGLRPCHLHWWKRQAFWSNLDLLNKQVLCVSFFCSIWFLLLLLLLCLRVIDLIFFKYSLSHFLFYSACFWIWETHMHNNIDWLVVVLFLFCRFKTRQTKKSSSYSVVCLTECSLYICIL